MKCPQGYISDNEYSNNLCKPDPSTPLPPITTAAPTTTTLATTTTVPLPYDKVIFPTDKAADLFVKHLNIYRSIVWPMAKNMVKTVRIFYCTLIIFRPVD